MQRLEGGEQAVRADSGKTGVQGRKARPGGSALCEFQKHLESKREGVWSDAGPGHRGSSEALPSGQMRASQ